MFWICVWGIWGMTARLGLTQATPETTVAAQAPTPASSQQPADFKPISDAFKLSDCESSCLKGQAYDTYDAAKASCEDLDQSLFNLYSCMSKSPDPSCLAQVQAAQVDLEEYCVIIGALSSAGASTFAVTTTDIRLPVTTPPTSATSATAASNSEVTGANGPSTTVASSDGVASPSSIVAAGPSDSTASPSAQDVSKNGLSQTEQIGVGVGVGVGVPLLLGIAVVIFCLARRRKTRRNSGLNPYGPVHSSEKAALEDGSVNAGSQEMHPMNSSATPFLPAVAAGGVHQHHDEREEEEPSAPRDSGNGFQESGHRSPAPLIMPPDRSQSPTSATPYPQQAQVPHRSATSMDDEPPSPVSPVSPVSGMGSRPASLHSQNRHHDLS